MRAGWLSVRFGNVRAVENARVACIEASRRRVEREEVALYLARALSEDAARKKAAHEDARRPAAPTRPERAVAVQ